MLYIFVEHLSIHPFQQWGRRREHIIYPVIVVDGSIQKIVQDGPCRSKYLAWQTCLKLDSDDNHGTPSLRQFGHLYGHGLDRVEHPNTAQSIKRFSVGWNILMIMSTESPPRHVETAYLIVADGSDNGRTLIVRAVGLTQRRLNSRNQVISESPFIKLINHTSHVFGNRYSSYIQYNTCPI